MSRDHKCFFRYDSVTEESTCIHCGEAEELDINYLSMLEPSWVKVN